MKKNLLYISLLIILSCSNFLCSKKKYSKQNTSIPIENKKKGSKIRYLSGKIYTVPKLENFYPAVLLLYYNDSIKIYSASDFDGNFSFYDFKPKLITKKSYLYIANKGCVPKKIMFDRLIKPIVITLEQDSIKGLNKEELIELHHKNRPID